MEKFKLVVDDSGKIRMWMDGCIIKGVQSIEFYWEIGEIPTHKVEFTTQATAIDRKYSQD